jgi:hypothetical protein
MKGFRNDVAKKLFTMQQIHRWVFDTEILFLASKYRIEVRQIPVSWSNAKGSKVRFRDMGGSFVDLFRIRWNEITGKYH